MDTLSNYPPTITRVAFWGVEEEPVVWRQLGSLAEGVRSIDAFQISPG